MRLRHFAGAALLGALISSSALAQTDKPRWVDPAAFSQGNPCFMTPSKACLVATLLETIGSQLDPRAADFQARMDQAMAAAPYILALDQQALLDTASSLPDGRQLLDFLVTYKASPGTVMAALIIHKGEAAARSYLQAFRNYKPRFPVSDYTMINGFSRFKTVADPYPYLPAVSNLVDDITKDPTQKGIALMAFLEPVFRGDIAKLDVVLPYWPPSATAEINNWSSVYRSKLTFADYEKLRAHAPPGEVRQKLARNYVGLCPEGTELEKCLTVYEDTGSPVDVATIVSKYIPGIARGEAHQTLLLQKLKFAPKTDKSDAVAMVVEHSTGAMGRDFAGALKRYVLDKANSPKGLENVFILAGFAAGDPNLPFAPFADVSAQMAQLWANREGATTRALVGRTIAGFVTRKASGVHDYIAKVPPTVCELYARSAIELVETGLADAAKLEKQCPDKKRAEELQWRAVAAALKQPRPDAFDLLTKLPPEGQGQAISEAYIAQRRVLSEADAANIATIATHWPDALYEAVLANFNTGDLPVGLPIPLQPLEDAAFRALAKEDNRFHDLWLLNYALASGDVTTILRVASRLRATGNLKWTALVGEAAMMVD